MVDRDPRKINAGGSIPPKQRQFSCPFSSMAECLLGKEATQDRNLHRAPCSNSPIGRDDALRTHAMQVRILLGAPIAWVAQRQRPLAQNKSKYRFSADSNPASGPCSVSQMGRHRFYTPARRGSIPRRSTIHASLAQWQSTCSTRKLPGVRFTEGAPSWSHSTMEVHPPDKGKTSDRNRLGLPTGEGR